MTALYNEIEPYCVEWLGNLIDAQLIAPGHVAPQSIVELTKIYGPFLERFTQAHFFAGIGVWSHALREAGWPDHAEIWTGSCPCQPFSNAGKKKGFKDERHLWPTWFDLICKHRPPVVVGEQVASPDGLKWFDAVHADLERAGYAVTAFDLCVAGVGAPHIRQRLYFVALLDGERLQRVRLHLRERRSQPAVPEVVGRGDLVGVADGRGSTSTAAGSVAGELGEPCGGRSERDPPSRRETFDRNEQSGVSGGLGNARLDGDRQHARELSRDESEHDERQANGDHAPVDPSARDGMVERETDEARRDLGIVCRLEGAEGKTQGFWKDAEWCLGRDGKARPIEPGAFPLAYGTSGRVGRLRAYGNAVVGPLAKVFLEAVIDHIVESD